VLHSAALRRLAAKTQVVGVGVDDFPRTRLTHSLECAQIGRELGGTLGADPDVVDAACLAHDLGHPPFGHNGEQALDELAAPCGGFEGNAQSLRILTRLEAKTLDADGRSAGLNLTRATLDATVKYPWERRFESRKYGVYVEDLPVFGWLRRGAPEGVRCLEAQIMDWADDVAYSVHDFEDGVHAGHVRLAELTDPAVVGELAGIASSEYSGAPPAELRESFGRLLGEPWWVAGYDGARAAQVALKRMTSELIGRMVTAAVGATRAAYGGGPLRRYSADLVVPPPVRAECAMLKAVSFRYVMNRPGVAEEQQREREMVAELAAALAERAPAGLEPAFAEAWSLADDDAGRLRAVIDQVASLTDTSARAWLRAFR
jgi:dGTPase